MNSFDDVLSAILESMENNPSSDVEKVILEKVLELGLSEQGKSLLNETNSIIDANEKMYKKLLAAKASGVTRTEWLQEELLEISGKHGFSDEQKEQLMKDVSAVCENELNTTISEGE